jgi:hypothetical protein
MFVCLPRSFPPTSPMWARISLIHVQSRLEWTPRCGRNRSLPIASRCVTVHRRQFQEEIDGERSFPYFANTKRSTNPGDSLLSRQFLLTMRSLAPSILSNSSRVTGGSNEENHRTGGGLTGNSTPRSCHSECHIGHAATIKPCT